MTTLKKLVPGVKLNPCLLIMVIFLSACAPQKSRMPPPTAPMIPPGTSIYGEDMSWWVCRFKVSWPPDTPADGAVDLLLAHAVVEPVLKKHAKKIPWWRFHRRAARDKVGHQFRFLFYADSGVASVVMEEIKQSDILQQALEEKVVEKIMFSDPAKPVRPQIEDTSDPHWPQTIQRNWPSFIMGVSALWLGLIDDQMAQFTSQSIDISEHLESYRQEDTAITSLWRKEGQHAFLHHLNAVFGYEPLSIRKEIMF
jgi:hypothetical protein